MGVADIKEILVQWDAGEEISRIALCLSTENWLFRASGGRR